jgi:hypothetical protein
LALVVVVLFPAVIEEKFSLKTCVPFPLEAMVMASVAVPVPVVLVAERVALVVPAAVGVPEMRPVALLTESPVGRLAAANEVGEFEAVIW